MVEAIQRGPKQNGGHKNGGGAPQFSEARKKLTKAIEERDEAKRELTATDRAVDGRWLGSTPPSAPSWRPTSVSKRPRTMPPRIWSSRSYRRRAERSLGH